MNIAYSTPTTADSRAIAALFRDSFTATFGHLYHADDLAAFFATITPERFAAEIGDPEFHFCLAWDGDALAGFIKLGPPELPVDTPPDTIELRQLYVGQSWLGAGVGHDLMDWALATAALGGAKHVQLSVFVDNHRARRFYERYSFTAVGHYGFMVSNHRDEDIVLRHAIMDRPA